MEISTFQHFQRFSFQFFISPHPQTLETVWSWSSWLIKGYTDEDFWKVISFFSYKLLKSLQQAVIDQLEKGILINFFGNTLPKLVYHHQLCKI